MCSQPFTTHTRTNAHTHSLTHTHTRTHSHILRHAHTHIHTPFANATHCGFPACSTHTSILLPAVVTELPSSTARRADFPNEGKFPALSVRRAPEIIISRAFANIGVCTSSHSCRATSANTAASTSIFWSGSACSRMMLRRTFGFLRYWRIDAFSRQVALHPGGVAGGGAPGPCTVLNSLDHDEHAIFCSALHGAGRARVEADARKPRAAAY